MLNSYELELLNKSAEEWMNDKTGWIPFAGMTMPLEGELVDTVNSLQERGFVEITSMWGQGWYRVNIVNIVHLLESN